MIKKIFFCGIFLLTACESDDLCDKAVSTPRLVVRFKDNANLSRNKSVENLVIYGENNASVLVNSTADSVALPLKLVSPTSFVMLKDAVTNTVSGTLQIISGNVATVTFSYQTEEEFMGKACGFRTIYKNISVAVEDETSAWVKSVIVKNETINNEAAAQIQFSH